VESSIICDSPSKRINNFEKLETTEIRVARADTADSMLAHENRRVRIVKDIAGEMRVFRENRRGNLQMAVRRHEQA
jgi:hypothetical protein